WAFIPSDKPVPTFFSDDPLDTIFWRAIQDHKAHQKKPVPAPELRTIGAEHDALASTAVMDRWPALKCLCHLVAQQTEPQKSVAAVVGMRDEGPTTLEWIAHHKAIGVDRIFVYTNDNTDKTDEILKVLADHDVITLIANNNMSRKISPQHKMYEHFLRILPEARDYE